MRQRDDGGGLERRGFLQRAAWLGGAVLGSSIPATLRAEFLRVNYRLEKEGPFDPGEMILSGSIP